MSKWLKVYVSGVFMGAADVVPGVSGGTIAFVLGIYDRLIAALSGVNQQSLSLLLKRDFKGLWAHFDGTFLLTLGAGVLTSIVLMANLVTHLLAVYPVYLWSFFFGLILASAYYLIQQVHAFSTKHFLLLSFGILIGAALSLLVPVQVNTSLFMVFVSGMIAICAMILPGVSGSFLLLVLGMYGFILSAIKSVDILVIAIFAAGALLGLLTFSKVLHYLLKNFRSMTLSLLTGVMLGALIKVWPWKEVVSWRYFGEKKVPLEETLILPWNQNGFILTADLIIPIIFFLLGFLIIFLSCNTFLQKK
ncbi:DUF368 domain-containing protein [Marinomonas sp. C2222]|uniref:DUF368 domain-containing protein n=1 Tax=Marinomonas sargassi TaxID=2984494 RepID=A0ABT2YV84_9GAMM|nr:DUF368 domain-containing protein [Marinomonas sargassi]MCV2403778.1 DUF368 domain-containing protein [Marinomonas sargassi]